jgi:hypothetical protein
VVASTTQRGAGGGRTARYTSLPSTEAVAQPGGILHQLAAYSRRVRAAAITSLVAASAGLGLLPIAIEAGEGSTERIEGSAAEHVPMQPWLMSDGTPATGLKGQTQTGNWSG